MAMGNGNGQPSDETLRQEIERMRESAASVVVMAERVLMAHYGMPREKRLIVSRAERRGVVQSYSDAGGAGEDE